MAFTPDPGTSLNDYKYSCLCSNAININDKGCSSYTKDECENRYAEEFNNDPPVSKGPPYYRCKWSKLPDGNEGCRIDKEHAC